MNRDEATQALEILSKVVRQAKDETALQNWGTIWVVHGFTNAIGFVATHFLLQRGYLTPWPHVGVWACVIGGNLASIAIFKRERGGVKSFVEAQNWAVWTIYMVAMGLTAILNYLMGLSHLFIGPIGGVLSAVAFASMGTTMGRGWFVPSVVFVLASFAMAIWAEQQLLIFGGLWFFAQTGAGLVLRRARQRRLARAGGLSPTIV